MATNEIEILVKAEVAKALTELDKVAKKPKELETGFSKFFGSAKAGWLAFAGILSGVVAGALGKVTQKGIEFLDLNDDFTNFFKGIEGDANDARTALVNGFGYSTEAATKLLQSLGQVGNNLGFTRSESLKVAESIGKLSAAWGDANPNGIKAAQAADIFRNALQGNYKGLRQLGIAFDENDVKNKAIQMGLIRTGDVLNDTAKAQATMALLTEKSTGVMASFSAAGGSLAERIDRAKSVIEDLTTAIGIDLATRIDTLTTGFDGFKTAGDRLEYFKARAKDVIDVVIAVIGLALVPLETSVRTIVKSIATAGKALTNLNVAFKFLKAGEIAKSFDSLDNVLENLGEAIANPFIAAGDTIQANYKRIVEAVKITTVATVENSDKAAGKQIANSNAVTINFEENEKKKKQIAEDTAKVNAFLAEDEQAKKQEQLRVQYEEAIAAANRLGVDKVAIETQYQDQITEINRQANLKRATDAINSISTVANAASATATAVSNFITTTAEEDFKAGKITEDEKKKRLKEGAEIQKAVSITQAIINTAQAVTAALAVPIIGPILAPIVGALGAAQVALIAATPIPAFASGGIVNGPQMVMAGERGREAILPNDLTELLLSAAGRGNGGSGTMNITVVANDPIQFNNQLKRRYGREVFQ